MIHPIIMSGGSGTRLWPVSRALYPKQFLKLTASGKTLLQDAALRVSDATRFFAPIIICSEEHRFIIAEQLREIDITPQAILLEPVPRSTAVVAALSARFLLEKEPEKNPLFLLLPTDHAIGDVRAFLAAVDAAAQAAVEGYLATFGIKPEAPETGYGYIKPGQALKAKGVSAIAAFVEKPDAATAKTYVQQGYLWNSGMFLFAAKQAEAELKKLQPEIVAQVGEALHKAARDLDFIRLDKDAFAKAPSISVDVGLMEKTTHAAVAAADMRWNDIGSWTALWDIAEKDKAGNAVRGDVMLSNASNSYVQSEGVLTVGLGIEDLIVVAMSDVVMVAAKDHAQEVREVVQRLKSAGRSEAQHARRVHRPWGWYESLTGGPRFQVKRIMVEAGRSLSLQMHHHRSEHWVVVAGMAKVTKNDEEKLIYENESVYLPAGTRHRLANPGKVPLMVVEVQTGTYLGEDDIVRYEDKYGRS